MFDKSKYIDAYNSANYRSIRIRVRKDDALVNEQLDGAKGSLNSYVVDLIRKDAYKHRHHNFINDEVLIDFPVCHALEHLIDQAEQADYENRYEIYMNVVDAIDVRAKREVMHHHLTESQWNKLLLRYCL